MRKRIVIDGNSTGSMMYWTDRFTTFFNMISRKLDFDIRSADTFESFKRVTAGMDLILAFACEQRPNRHMQGLITLDKKKKFILYMHDVHWAKIKRNQGTTQLLERADLVMVPYYTYFKEVWPQFIHKTVFFPHFFAPHSRYCDLKYKVRPRRMKCLLVGNIKQDRYPIRWIVKESVANRTKMKSMVHILKHPRHSETQYWNREKGGEKTEYPKTLNEYFCSVTDSSMWHLLLTKYFEIPAAGALLLADVPEDGERVGLIPWKHYVPVAEDSVLKSIKDCLSHPEKYEEIRKRATTFIRAFHSVNARFEQFKKLLERVL